MLSILLGKGDGTFRVAGEIQVGRFPHYVAAGDWNGDGHQDLAVACAGEDAIILLQGDGTGMLRKSGTLTMGNNPHGLVAADFNGDGFPDLVGSARTAGEISVFLGDGKGGFTVVAPLRINQDIIALAANDFDRDGKMDLALALRVTALLSCFAAMARAGFRPLQQNKKTAMDHINAIQHFQFERVEYRNWLNILWRPIVIAAAAVTILLLIIVAASHPAWSLLGIGRGFVPEELYPISGFVIVFVLTFGHAIAWAIGSVIVFYLIMFLRSGDTWKMPRDAMAAVYLILGPLPSCSTIFSTAGGSWTCPARARRVARRKPSGCSLAFDLWPPGHRFFSHTAGGDLSGDSLEVRRPTAAREYPANHTGSHHPGNFSCCSSFPRNPFDPCAHSHQPVEPRFDGTLNIGAAQAGTTEDPRIAAHALWLSRACSSFPWICYGRKRVFPNLRCSKSLPRYPIRLGKTIA